jgi:hypothetical protein
MSMKANNTQHAGGLQAGSSNRRTWKGGLKPRTPPNRQQLKQQQQQQCTGKGPWGQQYEELQSWQQLYHDPHFLKQKLLQEEPSGLSMADTLMTAAALLARLVRQQQLSPGSTDQQQQQQQQQEQRQQDSPQQQLERQQQQQQQDPQQQQQQEEVGPKELWLWYSSTLLGRYLDEFLADTHTQQQQQQQQQRWQKQQQRQPHHHHQQQAAVLVTASALLHATGAMGWAVSSIAQVTGLLRAQAQLKGTCLKLCESGLQASLSLNPSSADVGTAVSAALSAGEAGFGAAGVKPALQEGCPPIAVVNLVCAMQSVGVKVTRDYLKQQQEAALTAVLLNGSSSDTSDTSGSSSSSSSGSNGGSNADVSRRRLSYPALVKLLSSFVLRGERMSGELLQLLVANFQVQFRACTQAGFGGGGGGGSVSLYGEWL